MASRLERRAGARLRERLKEKLGSRLLEVRLYGSRARGDARPDSDLDVFVLVDEKESHFLRLVARECTEVMLELKLPFVVIPLVMDRREFQKLKDRELRLGRDLETEGIPV